MKRGLLIFLAICAFTAAMVPRNRRAVNSEEQLDTSSLTSDFTSTTTTKETERPHCASQTPCAWTIYKANTKIIEMNITNTYCDCSPSTQCQEWHDNDDLTANMIVHRCQLPREKPDEIES